MDAAGNGQKEPGKPYIAIVVLVCGVIGGLIIVISFIFFCKFCFKKNQPLASAASPEKNEPYAVKPKHPKQGYQILDGSNSLASPVPADLETYLQQPANINNNNLDLLKSEFLLVNQQAAKDLAAHKKLCQIAEDELLIIQKIEDDDRHQGSTPDVENLFRRCSLKRNDLEDIEVLSIKQGVSTASSRVKRQRAYSNASEVPTLYPPRHADFDAASPRQRQRADALLSVEDPFIEAARRRSFDERLTGVGKRRLPNIAQVNNFYANEYDRKRFDAMDEESNTPPLTSLSTDESSVLLPPGWAQQQKQALLGTAPVGGATIHLLPRSHQIIADKTSPPGVAANGPYPRDHRNSKSYGTAEQDLLGNNTKAANAALYSRDHRLAFSFTETGEQRHRLPVMTNFKVTQPTILLLSPDRRSDDLSSSMNSGYEADTLNRFYIRCREVFDKTPAGYVSTGLSSSSSENHRYRSTTTTATPSTSMTQRQAKSVENAGDARYADATADRQRQAQSLDSSGCKVCLNDVVNRQTTLRRQDMLDHGDADLEHLDDAYSEKIKKQCKDLWSLRRVLEDERYYDGRDDVVDDVYDLPSPDDGATSYTTSFESNTEPLTVEDYLRSARPSGPFLEPPRLSVEAKRAKLKNLYAKRQLQLLQQGVSAESYESYETFDSSGSSKPEQILTSFESNHGEQTGTQSDSTVDSRRKMVALQKDSGYKSQSTETQGHGYDASLDKSAPPPPAPTTVTVATVYRQQQPSGVGRFDQQQSFDSTLSDCCPDPPLPPSSASPLVAVSQYVGHATSTSRHHATSRERDAVGAFFDAVNNGNDTASGESFDDVGGIPIPGVSAEEFAYASRGGAYPNVHLARIRRSFESPSSVPLSGNSVVVATAHQARDYSVDARTDALYREFVKFDPRLEQKAPSRRGLLNNNNGATKRGGLREVGQPPRFGYSADAGFAGAAARTTRAPPVGGRLRQKLSTEESIEEERAPTHDYDTPPAGANRYDIPIIKLPDDNESSSSFSGVKVQ